MKLLLIRLAITAVGAAIVFGTFSGLKWYFTQTAEGRRAVVDQRSNMNNGLERTINILNADGEVIRTYTGVIDIEGNDGGYVVFDYERFPLISERKEALKQKKDIRRKHPQ